MIVMKDRIADMQWPKIGRYSPIPKPYIWHIRERFHLDGRVELIHCWKVYEDGIPGK